MAIGQVQVIQPRGKVKKGKEGGGAIGRKLGAVVGAVAGGVTGGPGGAISGASTGAGLGGMAGEAVKPGSQDQVTQANQSAGLQNVQRSNTTRQLEESLMALKTQSPKIKQQYGPTLVQGYMASLAQDNPRGTA